MLNEVEKISGSDVIEFLGWFGKSPIQLDDGVMNSNDGVDHDVVSLFAFFDWSFEGLHHWIND